VSPQVANLLARELHVLIFWSHVRAHVLQPAIVSIRGRGNPGPCRRCPSRAPR